MSFLDIFSKTDKGISDILSEFEIPDSKNPAEKSIVFLEVFVQGCKTVRNSKLRLVVFQNIPGHDLF